MRLCFFRYGSWQELDRPALDKGCVENCLSGNWLAYRGFRCGACHRNTIRSTVKKAGVWISLLAGHLPGCWTNSSLQSQPLQRAVPENQRLAHPLRRPATARRASRPFA